VHEAGAVTALIGNALAALVVDVGEDERGALANEEPCSCLADPAGCTGNDTTMSIEAAHGDSHR